jgi:hypothetical protein
LTAAENQTFSQRLTGPAPRLPRAAGFAGRKESQRLSQKARGRMQQRVRGEGFTLALRSPKFGVTPRNVNRRCPFLAERHLASPRQLGR